MTDGGESPFWKYEDLGLFVGSILPAWLVGLLLVRMSHTKNEAARTLIFQASFFLLLLGVLYGLISVRYGKPFWRSLGWVVPARGAWWCVAAAPVLAVGTTVLGVLLHEPRQIVAHARERRDPGPAAEGASGRQLPGHRVANEFALVRHRVEQGGEIRLDLESDDLLVGLGLARHGGPPWV